MKKILALAFAAALCVSAAFAVDRPAWAESADAITGSMTVYTTMDETQQKALRSYWSSVYPKCKLEFQSDSVGTLITRLTSEAGRPVADVLIGGLFEADGDRYHNVLQPYTTKLDDQLTFHDKGGYYTLYDVQIMGLIVNKDIVEDLGVTIEGYNDLLNPKLAGKIIQANPATASSAYRQLQTILAVMGDSFNDDKCWEYIGKLIKQCQGISTNSSSQVYNDVINGEYAVGLSYESAIQAMVRDGADNVKCVYMKEGNTAMASGGAIVKGAPNLKAAKAMMDMLASAEFQDIRNGESGGRGTNKNCKDTGLPSEAELKLTPLDFDYLGANKAALLDRWSTMWEQSN